MFRCHAQKTRSDIGRHLGRSTEGGDRGGEGAPVGDEGRTAELLSGTRSALAFSGAEQDVLAALASRQDVALACEARRVRQASPRTPEWAGSGPPAALPDSETPFPLLPCGASQ
eukprot:scaffold1459_cov260-Pinguiococcus_pyrenoidosus.AAC.23